VEAMEKATDSETNAQECADWRERMKDWKNYKVPEPPQQPNREGATGSGARVVGSSGMSFLYDMFMSHVRPQGVRADFGSPSALRDEAEAVDEDETYTVEYARSGRATCRHCSELIPHLALRMGIETPPDEGAYGYTRWFHIACVPELNAERQPRQQITMARLVEQGTSLSGLSAADRVMLRGLLAEAEPAAWDLASPSDVSGADEEDVVVISDDDEL